MKKFLQIFAVLFAVTVFGQNISDYRYVMIPGTFKDVKTNRYDLNDLLALKFKQKKYIVLSENQNSWPIEAVENPCSVLTAELEDSSNMFRNRILIKFFDCKGKEISALEGKSFIKEFEPGMRDALELSAKNIAVSSPVAQEKMAQTEPVKTSFIEKIQTGTETKPSTVIVQQEIHKEISPSTVASTPIKISEKAEVYSSGTLFLNKINLGDGEFILVNPQSSVPFATFKPSSKKDTFRVKLSDGNATLGYLENGKIVVEIPNSDGSFKNEIFERK